MGNSQSDQQRPRKRFNSSRKTRRSLSQVDSRIPDHDDNRLDLQTDLHKVADKWVQLTKSLAVMNDEPDEFVAISKTAFENQFHESAPFLGSLLFQHFQLSTKSADRHTSPDFITQKVFVVNVMELLKLTSDGEQTRFYFKVFSKGSDTLHEDEMLMLLTVSVKLACSATGLSRLISDADQQVFHALVRSLDVDSAAGVDATQFGDWIQRNGVHLLNCLHNFVVQALISCTGLPNEHIPKGATSEDDSLPILDQDNEKCLQLNSTALLWLLSCALPRCYIKRSTSPLDSTGTCRGFPSVNSACPLTTVASVGSLRGAISPSPSCPTMNPHQFIQQLVAAANLTTWTLLYNSDKHGLCMNRFLHHTLHYSGPTVSIYRLESGSAYCVAVDTEWRESPNRWGGSDCVIYQLQPEFKRLERGANLIYLNEHARGSYRGLEIGTDPKRPILKVEANMHSAENSGKMDKLECVEVWGCAGSAPKVAQLEQIRWENRQAERVQKITRPGKGVANDRFNADRYLIDLVKNNTRYTD